MVFSLKNCTSLSIKHLKCPTDTYHSYKLDALHSIFKIYKKNKNVFFLYITRTYKYNF